MTHPRVERHRDEIDAVRSSMAWVERLIQSLPPSPHYQVDDYRLKNQGGASPAGGLRVFWYDNKLLAQIAVFRDDMNFTVVTMQDLRERAI